MVIINGQHFFEVQNHGDPGVCEWEMRHGMIVEL